MSRYATRPNRWQTVLEVINASGPAGIDRDELAKASGVSVKSVHGLVSKARVKLGINCGRRDIDGREVYFSAEHRPAATPQKRSQAPEKIRAAVLSAGKAGVARCDMLNIVSQTMFKRYSPELTKAGELFIVGAGLGRAGSRYFSTAKAAAAFAESHRKVVQAKAIVHDKKRVERRAVKAASVRPVLSKKEDPYSAIKAAPAVNPFNVRPVEIPPNQPNRYRVEQVGRHVSANECRPWAMYA